MNEFQKKLKIALMAQIKEGCLMFFVSFFYLRRLQ